MNNLTKKQENILKTNLDELKETIISNTMRVNGDQVLFNTVNEIGCIYEYFVDFKNKYCLKQTLSTVCILEIREQKSFKF